MPVSELVTFTASEEYLADPIGTIQLSYGLLSQQPGLIKPSYYGIQHENKNTAVTFLNWESVESHHGIVKHPNFQQIMDEFQKMCKGDHSWQHIDIQDSASLKAALSAPLTEIVTFKLKPEASREAFLEKVGQLAGALVKEAPCHGAAVGESVENKGTFIGVVGWDSIEAKIATGSKEAIPPILGAIFELADPSLMHTSFTAVEK